MVCRGDRVSGHAAARLGESVRETRLWEGLVCRR